MKKIDRSDVICVIHIIVDPCDDRPFGNGDGPYPL